MKNNQRAWCGHESKDHQSEDNKWDRIKLKEAIDRVKMQCPEREETSANLISEKGLASKIRKEFTPLNSKRANDFFNFFILYWGIAD